MARIEVKSEVTGTVWKIEKAVGDMPRRLQRLYEAKGHHFEEGGKSK